MNINWKKKKPTRKITETKENPKQFQPQTNVKFKAALTAS